VVVRIIVHLTFLATSLNPRIFTGHLIVLIIILFQECGFLLSDDEIDEVMDQSGLKDVTTGLVFNEPFVEECLCENFRQVDISDILI